MISREIVNNLDEVRGRLTPWLATKLKCPALSVSDLQPLTGGLINAIHLVVVTFPFGADRPNRRFVLRWDPLTGPQEPYDMANQFETYVRLSSTLIPVPAPLWLEDDPTVLGRTFWISEFIEGESPGRLPETTDPFANARMASFVAMLTSIHTVDWQAAKLDSVRPVISSSNLDRLVEEETPHFAGVRDAEDIRVFEKSRDWLRSFKPHQFALCLTHGDCSLSNYMFEGTKIVAVVDWDLSLITDRARDVGFYCSLIFRFNSDERTALKQRKRRDFIAHYERHAHVSLQNLQFWEVYANYHNALSWTRSGWSTQTSGYSAYTARLRSLMKEV